MLKYCFPLDSRTEERHCSPSGDTIRKKYQLDVLPNGEEKLVEVGEENIQDAIQAHVTACDLKQILKRHEMMGTIQSLAHTEGGLVDLTKMPSNLHEIKKLLNTSEAVYDLMPEAVKAQFPTADAFLANFGSMSTYRAFVDAYGKKPAETKNKPVGGTSDASDS